MSERAIYLVGAGGHGRVLLDALNASGARVQGIIDPGLARGMTIANAEILGGDDILATLNPEKTVLVLGIGANPDTGHRTAFFRDMKLQRRDFLAVSHPSAIMAVGAHVGEGCQRMAGSIIQCGARLGANVVLNTGATIDHDCAIGDHVFISPGATICGSVKIGSETFVGAGAVIVPGLTIGEAAVIGAGALVLHDIESGQVAMGVPAQSKRRTSRV